jgi:site-specific recombinase
VEKALSAFLQPNVDTLAALKGVVDALRPRNAISDIAIEHIETVIELLATRPDLRDALCHALSEVFFSRHAVLLFATSGIYPETGLLIETRRRINQKMLPDADDEVQLKYVFARLFKRSDAKWVEAVPTDLWVRFIRLLFSGQQENVDGLYRLEEDLFEALRVVAHRIAAAGLEPEMLRLDPTLEKHESAFMALCEEALNLVQTITGEKASPVEDERHLLVLIDQCHETINRVRRRAQQMGASFDLTLKLQRLSQHLDRLEKLVAIGTTLKANEDECCLDHIATFWQELVSAECYRNDLNSFWQQNTKLVALRVTENAGKSGEHYITESRSEYWQMFFSAAGGGFIIAFMAANKILVSGIGLPPLVEVLAVCLNYGLGFVLIHILHFTVATKQPAMTANAIAAVIGEAEDGRKGKRDLQPLVTLVARTVRTQLVAILGNVGLAVPMAILLAYGLYSLTGVHFLTPEKSHMLLSGIDPIASGALVYAAIAGVCLFLAGLVAGYYDNLCAYNRIPERLYQLHLLQKLIGKKRLKKITHYISNNLGALAGNFFFGCMLGGVSGFGMLLGLPLDIRHIAFSSANWGFAMTSLDFSIEWQVAALTATGVALIGFLNLTVSFYLAMSVGLRARGVTIAQRMSLVRAIFQRIIRQPREFFLAPKK